MRQIEFRMDVLKSGIRAGSIRFDADSPPTISCDAKADIPLSMTGLFEASNFVDYVKDELQPVVIIDGVEHHAGVFRAGNVREITSDGFTSCDVGATDRSVVLSWRKTESHISYASGTTYAKVINDLMTDAGFDVYNMTPTSASLQSYRDWDIGISYLDIINELLDELAYDHLWFDNDGVAVMQPYQTPTVEAISHKYGNGDYRRISAEYSRQLQMFDAPNVFIVIRTSPDYSTAMSATAVNDNAMSRLSVTRRGIRIPKVTKVNNIASQSALQEYANRLRDQGIETPETVEIATAIQPGHRVGDIVAIEGEADLFGVYRETKWSFSMETGGWMTHTLERMVL